LRKKNGAVLPGVKSNNTRRDPVLK